MGARMAKKQKKISDEDKGGSKFTATLMTIAIILVWLIIFAVLIKIDLGGFGSNILSPILKNVPVVNKILPEEKVSEADKTVQQGEETKYQTLKEALDRINELEAQLANQGSETNNTSANVSDLQKEVERLKVFEENQVDFQEEKKKFYDEVVYNDKAPDISQYKTWYESIDPANAEEIYRQVVKKQEYTDKVKEYATTFSTMKPAAAAGILSTMTGDLDIVVDILNNLTPEERGLILGSMDQTIAAKITKKMFPVE